MMKRLQKNESVIPKDVITLNFGLKNRDKIKSLIIYRNFRGENVHNRKKVVFIPLNINDTTFAKKGCKEF